MRSVGLPEDHPRHPPNTSDRIMKSQKRNPSVMVRLLLCGSMRGLQENVEPHAHRAGGTDEDAVEHAAAACELHAPAAGGLHGELRVLVTARPLPPVLDRKS